MGLRDIKLATASVEIPGNDDLVVRGLSVAHLSALAGTHLAVLTMLFNKAMAGKQSLDMNDEGVLALGNTVLVAAPSLAADVIAMGSGDPSATDIASLLPFPVQLDALEKIIRLTFATEGALKNVVEIAVRALEGTTKAVAQLKS